MIKWKEKGKNNMEKESLLIKNTTREQRQEIVKKALAISLIGKNYPTNDVLDLVKLYIDGKMELEEVQKQVIEKYKKKEF